MENKNLGLNIIDISGEGSQDQNQEDKEDEEAYLRKCGVACAFVTIPGYNFLFTVAASDITQGYFCFKVVWVTQ
jgi:hypothetical protein